MPRDPLLVEAARQNDSVRVMGFIYTHHDLHVQDEQGRTALHALSNFCYQPLQKTFLEHGVNPDIKDNEGKTALHLAAGNGHLDCVIALLQHIAVPNSRDNSGLTPVHHLLRNSQISEEITLRILRAIRQNCKSCLHQVDPNGWNAFHYLAYKKILVEYFESLGSNSKNLESLQIPSSQEFAEIPAGSTPLDILNTYTDGNTFFSQFSDDSHLL